MNCFSRAERSLTWSHPRALLQQVLLLLEQVEPGQRVGGGQLALDRRQPPVDGGRGALAAPLGLGRLERLEIVAHGCALGPPTGERGLVARAHGLARSRSLCLGCHGPIVARRARTYVSPYASIRRLFRVDLFRHISQWSVFQLSGASMEEYHGGDPVSIDAAQHGDIFRHPGGTLRAWTQRPAPRGRPRSTPGSAGPWPACSWPSPASSPPTGWPGSSTAAWSPRRPAPPIPSSRTPSPSPTAGWPCAWSPRRTAS